MKILTHIFLSVLVEPMFCLGQTWYSIGRQLDAGVYSICDDDQSLYVSKGYSVSRNFIEVWNGSSWDSIGLDCGNQPRDLVFFDGKFFSPVCENGLEYFDGNSWASITQGTYPLHIKVIDSVLYAYGGFDSIGTIASCSINSNA